MDDNPDDAREDLLREASKLIGNLFVSRRDVKAVFKNGQWLAVREKFTLNDFRGHLFGDLCLGSYLLDADSTTRFIAFDIDLKKSCEYFVIRDLDELEQMEADGQYLGGLDPDVRHGNLEAALHDESHEGFRWARILLSETLHNLRARVEDMLSLDSLGIITGGGAHLLVPFGAPIPASEARAMAHSVMDGTAFHRRSESFYGNLKDKPSIEIEVFPKQDRLTDPESLGNLIRLPFGMHEVGIRTYAYDFDLRLPPPWDLKRQSSISALRQQARNLGLEVA